MRKTIKNLILLITLVLALLLPVSAVSAAFDLSKDGYYTSYYTDSNTSYQVIVDDAAELIDDGQEAELANTMQEITPYSNVALLTTYSNPSGNTEDYAEKCNNQLFGDGPGVVFMIDMENREIYIDSTGSARKTITSSYANTITDNVYTSASNGDYYRCASKAFQQMTDLFHGKRIAQPMKYISNALLALVLAAMINFFIVLRFSKKQRPSTSDLVEGVFSRCDIHNPAAIFLHQTRTYSPRQSSSGSSGSGGGGGGGHSGGGHSF